MLSHSLTKIRILATTKKLKSEHTNVEALITSEVEMDESASGRDKSIRNGDNLLLFDTAVGQ